MRVVDSRGRWWVLAVLGVLALLLGTGLVLTGRVASAPRGEAAVPVLAPKGTPRDTAGALGLLRRWDRARSVAWARGDVRGLRQLYVADAVSGTTDVTMLRQYVARGLTVRDLRMRVQSARLRHLDARVVRLEVTERLEGGVAVAADGSRTLPRAGVATRLVELRRGDQRWRVASVEAI